MRGRDTPPVPLERGGRDGTFLVGNERFVMFLFPLLRGD